MCEGSFTQCSSSLLGRLLTVDACALTLLYVVQHSDDLMRTLRAVSDSSNVAFVTPEATVFEAMLGGWESQQRSRGLRSTTIATRRRLILRLQEFSGRMPWEWNAQDVEEFISGPDQRLKSLSTMRHNHNAIKTFCAYLIDPNYDWVEICENQFGNHPMQVCLPWNTVAHKAQYEGSGKRRPLSFDEVETLFDTADAKVEELAASGKKGALAALRDSQIFKTARSEEHTSELQSRGHLVCRLLLEKKIVSFTEKLVIAEKDSKSLITHLFVFPLESSQC